MGWRKKNTPPPPALGIVPPTLRSLVPTLTGLWGLDLVVDY
jgi:hypothetical protein